MISRGATRTRVTMKRFFGFSSEPPPPPPPPPLPESEWLTLVIGAATALCILVIAAYRRPPVEIVRKLLTALYHIQGRLPPALAKSWRLLVTLAFQAIPAVDPLKDPYVTTYKLPSAFKRYDASSANDPRDAVLITGVTGFVGLHLLDYLLRTTNLPIFILVRARSVAKLRREAARYQLKLDHFDDRVTLLEGDCKRASLGLSGAQWAELGKRVRHVFHLAANSSFVATYEVLRGDWMPSFVALLEFCANHGAAFHMVGSVGRFAVDAHPTRRGVWTSGYMRCKAVQFATLERFRAAGLTCSWVDCAYVIGTLDSGGVNPGFHDSMWKAAAIQRAVGLAFPGDATLVPVDLLVKSIWLNANRTRAELIAPYMAIRLESMMTSAAIGVSRTVDAREFRAAAAACGFNPTFINAFVPLDIGPLVKLMHKGFDAPPIVARLFESIDEAAILSANLEYAKPQFGQLDQMLPRTPPRPLEAGLVSSNAVSVGVLRVVRHMNAIIMFSVLVWNFHFFATSHPQYHADPLRLVGKYLAFLSHWTLVVVVVYLCAAARITGATPPAPSAVTDALTALHNVALPSSIAVVPLFWGVVFRPEYATMPKHPSQIFVHGVNAICMLLDFRLARRAWRFADGTYVVYYGLCNLLFMLAYFVGSGCVDAPDVCDLDSLGHPYVYSVVDWRAPMQAALVSLLAIFIPVPLISLALTVIWTRRGEAGPEPAYPFGYNHNGTVALPSVAKSCGSVADVSAFLVADAAQPTAAVRAIGSAKSNTMCLASAGQVIRLDRMTDIVIADDRATAIVGAGCVLRSLVHTLADAGLQLYSTIELGNLTAGAMACSHTKNRHLPGEYGILSSYVCGVTLVDARGRVHTISESAHAIDGHAADVSIWGSPSEMMRHVRTSHGLLGVVCEVTVRVKPIAGRAITHTLYTSAQQFVSSCALQHSQSAGSVFAYFSPYNDRFLVEVTKPTALPPRGSWFWALREHFITVDYPLLFRLGDALPTSLASVLYAALARVGELALTVLHEHASAPPHAHVGWHDHASLTKFQWTFLAFPLGKAEAVFSEVSKFCREYRRRTGYCNAYFVSYVMERDASATFSYAANGPVVTIDPIAANTCTRFLPFCEALVAHLERTVGGLCCAFNQSIGVAPRAMGQAVRDHAGAQDFLAKRELCDPSGRFMNEFFEEVMAGVAQPE